MTRTLEAQHGTVYTLPHDFFGYFGWPSVTHAGGGTLYAVASGLRNAHVCPYGRTTICMSRDGGITWSSPRIINDSPFDDRDAGIVTLPDGGLLVSWFTSDNRELMKARIEDETHVSAIPAWYDGMEWMTDEQADDFCGAWVRTSADRGSSWQTPVRVPCNAPHGPIVLANGDLLYFGKHFGMSIREKGMLLGNILAISSSDGGRTWLRLGEVPIYPGTVPGNYHEPHVVELSDGRLIGHIRVQNSQDTDISEAGLVPFSIMQTESTDGGRTWTQAHPLGFHGSPPHLVRHSSGTVVCTYGCRQEPYGQRVALSHDEGKSWEHDFILRDDGPDTDLGYPCTVELDDGALFSVYYQKRAPGEKCSLLWSRWELP